MGFRSMLLALTLCIHYILFECLIKPVKWLRNNRSYQSLEMGACSSCLRGEPDLDNFVTKVEYNNRLHSDSKERQKLADQIQNLAEQIQNQTNKFQLGLEKIEDHLKQTDDRVKQTDDRVQELEERRIKTEKDLKDIRLDIVQNNSNLDSKITCIEGSQKVQWEKQREYNSSREKDLEDVREEFKKIKIDQSELHGELKNIKKDKSLVRKSKSKALSTDASDVTEAKKEQLVLLLCTNDSYLRAVATPIYKLKKERELEHISIKEQKLAGVLEFQPEQLHGASKVMLIAVPDPRGLIISETEPSQLGKCYKTTKEVEANIMLVYLTDTLEKSTKDLYHGSLDKLLEAQPIINELARKNKFISLRYKGDSPPQLNSAQSDAIIQWMEK